MCFVFQLLFDSPSGLRHWCFWLLVIVLAVGVYIVSVPVGHRIQKSPSLARSIFFVFFGSLFFSGRVFVTVLGLDPFFTVDDVVRSQKYEV